MSSKFPFIVIYLFSYSGYIGEYVDDHRAGKIVVELNGQLNKRDVVMLWTMRH